jgi:hypothetical protein
MAYTAYRMMAEANRRMVDFDPDSGSEVVVTLNPGASEKCLAIAPGFDAFLAGLVRTVGTGAVTQFRIIVADAADGTGNVATVVASGALTTDAVGDTAWLEASDEQVKAAMVATSAYIGVAITLVTSTDECIVYFERKPLYVTGVAPMNTQNYIS